MQYRVNPKNGEKLSMLGFGGMRLAEDDGALKEQVKHAVDSGVNYFDTAYIYQNSERRLGAALATGLRDKVNIATKIPHYFVKKYEDFDRLFDIQRTRLQTDYIDYYLVHMLSDTAVWERLVALHIIDWIDEKKAKGQIRNIGFSYHGGRDMFPKLLDAYDWEFTMIQYNYRDEFRQAGRHGLTYAANKGLPVMVMEPLRGGMLATGLPREAAAEFHRSGISRSPAEWAFRWIFDQPEVTCVLSGMGSMEILQENIRVAKEAEAGCLSDDEREVLGRVWEIFESVNAIPCTGCNYCMPCPAGVDIPTCFSCFNGRVTEGKSRAFIKYLMQTGLKIRSTNAGRCTKCGKCEAHCPQKIQIRDELATVKKHMEGIMYKPTAAVIKRFLKA